MKENNFEKQLEVIDINWPPEGGVLENLIDHNFQQAAQNSKVCPSREIKVASKWNFLRPLISKLKKIFYGEIMDSQNVPFTRQREFNASILNLFDFLRYRQKFLDKKIGNLQKFAEGEFEFVKDICEKWGQRLDGLEQFEKQISVKIKENNEQAEKYFQELISKIKNQEEKLSGLSLTLHNANQRLDLIENNLNSEIHSSVEFQKFVRAQLNNFLNANQSLNKQISFFEKLWQENWPKVDHLAEEFNKTNERLDILEGDWPKLAEEFNKTNERLDILEGDWPKISQIGDAVYQTNERIDHLEEIQQNNWPKVDDLAGELNKTNERIDSLNNDLAEFKGITGRIDHLEKIQQNNWPRVDQLEKLSQEIKENSEQIFENWAQLKKQVNFLEEVLPARDSLSRASAGQTVAAKKILLSDFDYLNFEEKFRGTAEKIKKHQSRYLEYFKNCRNVLDIGPGRGEFLALLKENNIKGFGVDNNRYAVASGKKSGLKIIYGQMPEYLRALKEKTLDGVFISHLLEHLEPAALVELVEQVYEKIKKDSCLVIETVNPFSFYALANFYLDLTHIRPIPPKTLEFLAVKNGFKKIKTLWLSPVPQKERLEKFSPGNKILAENFLKIDQTLFGFRDYALIFKK